MVQKIKAVDDCLLTEVDNSNFGSTWSNCECIYYGSDKVDYQLPVISSRHIIIAYASTVINNECYVGNATCNVPSSKIHWSSTLKFNQSNKHYTSKILKTYKWFPVFYFK